MSVIDNIVFVNPPTNGQWIVPIGSCRLDLAYWSVPIPLAHKTTLTILPSWHILTPSPNPFTPGVWRILAPPIRKVPPCGCRGCWQDCFSELVPHPLGVFSVV